MFGSTSALAKFEDYLNKRWFTIEVIVFERSNIDDVNTLEALAHPRPVSELERLDTQSLDGSATRLDEPATPIDASELLVDDEATSVPREATPQRLLLETPAAADNPTNEATRLDFLQGLENYELELESRHLAFVEDANPVLEAELQRLARPRNNRVVWRGHWLQATPDRKNPEPLEIAVNELDSGEFELSGSLEVTVNRYLHLHARLNYHDPAFSEQLMGDELGGFNNELTPAPNRANEQRLGVSPGARPSTEQLAIGQPLPEPLFMTLDETRRMRSGLLHYLDHPKMGLLVRIDKLKTPDALLAQYKLFEASQK